MKSSIKYTAVILFIAVVVAVSVYYFKSPEKTIAGHSLVIGFVDQHKNDEEVISRWQQSGITIELIKSCKSKKESKKISCAKKLIQSNALLVRSLNKSLVILSDAVWSSAVLQALNSIDSSHVSALVFLQPLADKKTINNSQLSRTLVVSALEDQADDVLGQRQLAAAMRNINQWTWFTMLARGEGDLLSHSVLPHMVSYMLGKDTHPSFIKEFSAESHWQQPIIDNSAFLENKEFIEEREVDNDILRILRAFYAYDTNLLKQWPLKTYKAFNLMKYRDHLPPDQRGRYVSFSNRKGHKFYLDLQRYGRYQPEFVIALDDEDNLYRLTSFYKTKQYYSWQQGGPDDEMLYSQSLGAFIHFQKPLPSRYDLPYLQYTSILFESIKFTDQDPYTGLKNLSYSAFRVLTMNCIPCHSVDDVGGAAHHLDYLTGDKQPGFAQPLQSYSEQVLNNFFFNQTATAQLIGVNPNYVDQSIGEELMQWILQR